MKIESDRAQVWAGIRHGRTLGSPVALLIENRDHANWAERMNPWPVDEEIEEVHLPRPGHADLAGVLKFGHTDVRNVLERASARETAARVAAGGAREGVPAPARASTVHSHVVQIGSVTAPPREIAGPAGLRGRRRVARAMPRRGGERRDGRRDRPRPQGEREPRRRVRGARVRRPARASGRTCRGTRRLDARIAWALMSIHAMKGVEIGDGFDARRPRRLAGPRRDLLGRGARLHARDQPRRRHRGRHDHRRRRSSRGSR